MTGGLTRTIRRGAPHVARLTRDRRGAVAVFGAMIVLLTAGVSLFATDLARTQIVRGRAQAAADAALLAAARDLDLNDADPQRLARGVFDANMSIAPGDVIVRNFRVSRTESEHGQAGLSLEADLRLPLTVSWLSDSLGLTDLTHLDLTVESAAVKESLGLELVMVLDNTGSMNGSKIRDLRTAATALTQALFGDRESVPNLHVGVVNYSAAVNVGRQHWDWMLTGDAVGDAAGLVGHVGIPLFDRAADSLSAIDAVYAPTQWKGCVMARSTALSETDAPPDPGGRFAPQFWPSSVLSYSPAIIDAFLSRNRKHSNIWPPIVGFDAIRDNTTLNRLLGVPTLEIDEDEPPVDERNRAGNNGYGPNLGCPAPMTPLVNSRRAIMTAINGENGVEAWSRGGTFGNLGLVWGWRMLSPRWRGLWRNAAGVSNPALPQDYDAPFNVKAIVMMTDGANGWFQTDYTAFGRPGDIIERNEIDASMLRLCQNIKDAGIVIFTVTFGSGVNDGVRDTYRRCASDPATERRIPGAKYFHAPSGAQLEAAFGAIGGQVTELRLTR